ncbi:MAG: tRNA (N(6)-L-threonylcarbamoyladenosine(37)-C(2))-methylthiotransferase MtaB, partial [Paracoccaceae bacterium]|nr:tRNA (N(6)-L-threonylcarbamoyladenosine(37)-C(2))-methylthiotransferase MtaB [Paracoccaceae bacterium]
FPYSPRPGTPAARMPQVNGKMIKERAAALRFAGAAQVDQHLKTQTGRTHHILMENARMGRTEQFTEVVFASDQPESQIVTAQITGFAGSQLTA